MIYKLEIVVFLIINGLLIGCGGGSSSSTTPDAAPINNDVTQASYRLLFIGNSHSVVNNMPKIVSDLIEQGAPSERVYYEIAPDSLFLSDHIENANTLRLINLKTWTHVILQAQKYSQSFSTLYPTDAAERLIVMIKNNNAIPILFPEWGQVGNRAEANYIHNIHQGIADRQAACVSPIGLAWDKALEFRPTLRLHATDGNHANLNGAILTALTLYETITKQPADLLHHLDNYNTPMEIQDFLGNVSSLTSAEHPACITLN